jgi:hypothetical protein
MHAVHILQQRLRNACPQMHLRRLQALLACVVAALRVQRVTVTELGRALPSAAQPKHSIKRVDRLAGNSRLHAERLSIYRAVAHWLLRGTRCPLIVVDWSELRSDRTCQLLRAAVAIGGRALTLYEEVHPLHRLGNPRVQRLFLSQLKALLPEGTLPIIVTDAGFRTPWFRAVASLGWHWIGRVRNRVHVRPLGTARWVSSKSVYPKAHARAQALGAYELAQTNALACNLYLIQHRKKHRIRKSAYGQPLRSSANQARARMHREPWLLAASPSLSAMSANQIVRCYAQRMQIEEAFRDLKSTRYGLGFELHLSRQHQRIEILLLIASLALLMLWLIGTAAKADGLQRHYQSNTRSTPPALSIFNLACMLLRHAFYISAPPIQLRMSSLQPAILDLNAL